MSPKSREREQERALWLVAVPLLMDLCTIFWHAYHRLSIP